MIEKVDPQEMQLGGAELIKLAEKVNEVVDIVNKYAKDNPEFAAQIKELQALQNNTGKAVVKIIDNLGEHTHDLAGRASVPLA